MQPAIVPATRPLAEGIYLGRQSILDRKQDLCAFELLFRCDEANFAHVTDGTLASATVIEHMLNEFGLESVLGPYKGFINLDSPLLHSDMIELLPRERVVLEILETVELDDQLIRRLRHLKQAGFTLALDDVVSQPPQYAQLIGLIDIVKIDIRQVGMAALPELVRALKPWRARLLAEKVDDRAQVQACLDLGFELFQGYYFARPEMMTGKRLSPAAATVLRLLGLLVADAESDQIAALLKQEPMLTMNLLRLSNSVGTGARSHVSSVSSAIMLIGRRQLQRWLQLLLYSHSGNGMRMPNALMQLAATRARMMELLAASWNDKNLEERAFMTGIMSLMETLLAIPMREILGSLPVADDIRAALLDGSGLLGRLLRLTRSVEQPEPRAVADLLPGLSPLTAAAVERAHARALGWANAIGA